MLTVIWDLENDPNGNVQHIAENGVTKDEVEQVVENSCNPATQSRSSGLPIVFGYTNTGRFIAVVFEKVFDDPLTVYPVTAFDVPEPA